MHNTAIFLSDLNNHMITKYEQLFTSNEHYQHLQTISANINNQTDIDKYLSTLKDKIDSKQNEQAFNEYMSALSKNINLLLENLNAISKISTKAENKLLIQILATTIDLIENNNQSSQKYKNLKESISTSSNKMQLANEEMQGACIGVAGLSVIAAIIVTAIAWPAAPLTVLPLVICLYLCPIISGIIGYKLKMYNDKTQLKFFNIISSMESIDQTATNPDATKTKFIKQQDIFISSQLK